MSKIQDGLKYTETHEWVRVEGSVAVIGITDHAQEELTDIVHVDYPIGVGESVEKGSDCVVIESCKAAADLYAPVSGKVTETNEGLADNPAEVNDDPYGKGWIIKIEMSDPSQLDVLMDADAYRAHSE
ncbi:MAG: glycine cleavage system protein GcvH [bacterium]|nr:glycine cleavage system protein GcvH [bacterium]